MRIEYESRFVAIEASDGAIADRRFNAERRATATSLALSEPARYEARWEPSSPNVLTLSDSSGRVVETKVTKRSFDAPAAGAFGTSEYARIADAGSAGVGAAVPYILARRVQARYRWSDASAPATIEGLEIEQIFDPTQTGFADLAGASPVLTTKARLLYSRIGNGLS